ncbi:MAG: hypothetical protein ABI356_10435 [Steroidobacteraceae bacterium]
MKRIWMIIGVKDVPLSFKWYQSLFGQPQVESELIRVRVGTQ